MEWAKLAVLILILIALLEIDSKLTKLGNGIRDYINRE